MGFMELIVEAAHRVRPFAGPIASSGRTRWLNPSGRPACLAAGNCPKIIKADREIKFAPAATLIARSCLNPCGPAAGWRVGLLRCTCREGGGLA